MFNEKKTEYSKKQGKEIEVWQSPKYLEAKEKAIELINSKKYGLTEGDFWILMNETKTKKMGYSGLIISHNGCLKINDNQDNKIDPKGFKVETNGYNNSLVYTYCDDDVYEVGEVSKDNCTNAYPYAMAFKRCFDRAVLKKCKLAYAGVYSDSEAEEFNNKNEEEIEYNDEPKTINATMVSSLREMITNLGVSDEEVINALKELKCKKLAELTYDKVEQFRKIISK